MHTVKVVISQTQYKIAMLLLIMTGSDTRWAISADLGQLSRSYMDESGPVYYTRDFMVSVTIKVWNFTEIPTIKHRSHFIGTSCTTTVKTMARQIKWQSRPYHRSQKHDAPQYHKSYFCVLGSKANCQGDWLVNNTVWSSGCHPSD